MGKIRTFFRKTPVFFVFIALPLEVEFSLLPVVQYFTERQGVFRITDNGVSACLRMYVIFRANARSFLQK